RASRRPAGRCRRPDRQLPRPDPPACGRGAVQRPGLPHRLPRPRRGPRDPREAVVSLITPSPYLRDGLVSLVSDLRARAEQAVQAQRDADAEVDRLRAELADAEDHAKACAAEVNTIAESIRWAEGQAAALSQRISPDPARQLAETGLMPKAEQPTTVRPATAATWPCPTCGGALTWAGEHYEELAHVATGREECPAPDEGPPFNVVQAPDAVVAALTGGTPAVPDDPPSEPGTLVATHGAGETRPLDPAVTTPDTGLAHPVPNPPPAGPAAPPGDGGGRHARPKGPRRTGGWPLIRRKDDEQDGDRTDG